MYLLDHEKGADVIRRLDCWHTLRENRNFVGTPEAGGGPQAPLYPSDPNVLSQSSVSTWVLTKGKIAPGTTGMSGRPAISSSFSVWATSSSRQPSPVTTVKSSTLTSGLSKNIKAARRLDSVFGGPLKSLSAMTSFGCSPPARTNAVEIAIRQRIARTRPKRRDIACSSRVT